MAAAVSSSVAAMMPGWLEGLMAETFFGGCGAHQNRRKSEKNIFCLLCCHSFCLHCLPAHHPAHPLLQVRRYVYQDVIRLDDLEKLIDCSYIQPYTINSAKVIFLNPRAQSSTRCCKAGSYNSSAGNTCFTCDRNLQDPFKFCSLSCKVDHMVYHGEDLWSIVYGRFGDGDGDGDEELMTTASMSISQFEGLRRYMDDADPTDPAACSTSNILLRQMEMEMEEEEYAAAARASSPMNNSNNNNGSVQQLSSSSSSFTTSSSRRKRAPRRSPLS
ncbi:protein RGF1 INDUCIBLE TRANSCRIPTION FACTOR 1 isoform X2 [Andrographis paniculata]|uniref:protein RGF1 INDUCIBLE TRANSCRIPTION FACTOR 1 isoform X2 n=1 Tax=Andrographis paniculata TaxID=175694 RepID=UPI0021E7BC56|nr:protein RGF1 INDUCIBLE TRANSCRIPTION FACTOR 1 isoform X2 [Andrographis paniculata]